MATDVESLLYLLELSEEILSNSSVSHDSAVKYEITRQKVFKKIGLSQDPSKLWLTQSDPKSPQNSEADHLPHEYLERLSQSHEITLKYAKLTLELLESFETLSHSLALVLDSSAPVSHKPLKITELEQISYKDLSKFREIEAREKTVLDSFLKESSSIQKTLKNASSRLEEKISFYEKTIKNFEQNSENVKTQTKSEKEQYERRLAELLEACHDYSEQIEKLKLANSETLEAEKKNLQRHYRKTSIEYEKNNSSLLEVIEKLEKQVKETGKDLNTKDRKIQQLSRTLKQAEEENTEKNKKLEENFKDFSVLKHLNSELESQVGDLNSQILFKDSGLAEAAEKIKFLQEELAKKPNTGQGLPLKTSESEEIKLLKVKNQELKDELDFYQTKTDLKEYLDLKNRYFELQKELKFYQTKEKNQIFLGKIQDLPEHDKKIDSKESSIKSNASKGLKNPKSQEINEASSFRSKISDLKEEILSLKTENLDLRKNNSNLSRVLQGFQEAIHSICQKFSKEPLDDVSPLNPAQLQNETTFISILISKLANDNDWLVERLSDLGEENFQLKSELSPKKLGESLSDLKATSDAFREFENSYKRVFNKND